MNEHRGALPMGHLLDGEYRIDDVLGFGGFGITYLARDTRLETLVAIKEYMPIDFALRIGETSVHPRSSADEDNYEWGLDRFLKEAQILAHFEHSNINKVHRFFEANGTAYMVLEYIAGKTLSALLKREGKLAPLRLHRLLDELLACLEEVHAAGFVHRDIKPANIMLRPDGGTVLIDFGAARQAIGQRSKLLSLVLTPGYAPIEQYEQNATDVGPWTDLYALGMTAYRCISGIAENELFEAVTRARLEDEGERDKDMAAAMEVGKGWYDEALLKAVDWAMEVKEDRRPRSVAAMQEALSGDPKLAPAPLSGSAARHAASQPRGSAGEVFRDCEECPEMVVLPAGFFLMGSSPSEEGRGDDEDPQHWVEIAQSFAVGKYEVTFAEWDACCRAGGCSHVPDDEGWGRGNRPVINVSWLDAQEYAVWLSSKTGKDYRLLTEAEWEYAARAGTTGPFHFGGTISTDQANYNGGYTYGKGRKGVYRKKTVAVGMFPANAFGLHDMHGNVWEWVEDCWHASYAGAPADGSAWTEGGDCGARLVRGGSWYFEPGNLRAAFRFWYGAAFLDDDGFRDDDWFQDDDGFRDNNVGFRVARTLAP